MRHLVSLFDLTPADVVEILDLATDLKARLAKGERPPMLENYVLAQVFEKPSLRTRNSFEVAMVHLGGSGIFLTVKEAGLDGRESLPDVAKVLSSYSDVITMRTFSQELIEDFTTHSTCPVINALSDDFHPCQGLTDLLTIRESLGELKGRTVAFVGDGNNVAASLAIAAGLAKMKLNIAAPDGYQLPDKFLSDLRARIPDVQIEQTDDPGKAVSNADVVYTDVWASMGQEAESSKRQQAFADYCVNSDLISKAPAGCRFMHDLPAKRGLEVTDEVIDGEHSIVFQQAENRMHLAKGLFVWLLKKNS
jgi:ornithine carbamoyltransferase